MIDYVAIGNRIKKIRRHLGITQETLSEMVNVTSTHISRIENGTSSPSLQTLVDICNALRITIDDLMRDSLPAVRPQIDQQLEKLLADCSAAELKFISNVIPVLLQELRNFPEG